MAFKETFSISSKVKTDDPEAVMEALRRVFQQVNDGSSHDDFENLPFGSWISPGNMPKFMDAMKQEFRFAPNMEAMQNILNQAKTPDGLIQWGQLHDFYNQEQSADTIYFGDEINPQNRNAIFKSMDAALQKSHLERNWNALTPFDELGFGDKNWDTLAKQMYEQRGAAPNKKAFENMMLHNPPKTPADFAARTEKIIAQNNPTEMRTLKFEVQGL